MSTFVVTFLMASRLLGLFSNLIKELRYHQSKYKSVYNSWTNGMLIASIYKWAMYAFARTMRNAYNERTI